LATVRLTVFVLVVAARFGRAVLAAILGFRADFLGFTRAEAVRFLAAGRAVDRFTGARREPRRGWAERRAGFLRAMVVASAWVDFRSLSTG
jgi:hypothetical protein